MRRTSAVAIVGVLLAGLMTVELAGAGSGAAGSVDTTLPPSQVLAAEVTPSAARPGEMFTVTVTGCVGGDVVAGLWVPFASDPVVSTGPLPDTEDPVVGTLTVPLGAAANDAHVVVTCSLDAEANVAIAVQVLAATTSTDRTPAVGGTPALTG